MNSIVQEARTAFQADEHQRALKLLQQAHEECPAEPEIVAELAIVLCYLQREDEAIDLLKSAQRATRFDELARILSRYTYCRNLMASRLGVDDAKGKGLREVVRRYVPDDPTECGIKLSACLIVKNEEKHLERCLKSIVNQVDEIVVVDTGSTDSTLEIAKAFGAKIGYFKWCDDFSAARNESLRLATGNWALWIDADEEVDPRSWNPIAEGLIRPQFGGYYTRIVNLMDEEGRQQYVHTPVRLFQLLPGVKFEGRVHEQVLQCFDAIGLPSATIQNVTLLHYGYQPEDMKEKGKTDRTIRMLEREVEESPTDPFHWFNLANAYSVARRPVDAVNAAKKCVEFIHPQNAFGSLAYQILCSGLNSTGRSEESIAACDQCKERSFFTILNQFEHALALMQLGRFKEALPSIDACLEMEWPSGMTGDYGIFRHKRHAMKGQILAELGRHEEALQLLDFSLGVDPKFPPANYAKGLALEKLGRLEEAHASFETALPDPDFTQLASRSLGRVCLSLGRTSDAAAHFKRAWELRPSDVECWVAWTRILEGTGSPQEMIDAYQAYAMAHVPNADLLVNWGRALVFTGQNDQALKLFSEAIDRDPTNSNAYFNTGDLLYKLGAYVESAENYEVGLRLQPDNAEGWFVLGNAMAQIGVLDGARTAYRQAISIAPQHQGAQYNLAIVSSEQAAAA